MKRTHKTSVPLFVEQSDEIKARTMKHHRDFYNNTGVYRNEVAHKICKCTNISAVTTRGDLYLHSIEACHYPLIECPKCKVLMEREDSQDHAKSNCDPFIEAGLFLQAMKKYEALKFQSKQKVALMNNPVSVEKAVPTVTAPKVSEFSII